MISTLNYFNTEAITVTFLHPNNLPTSLWTLFLFM